MIRILLAVLIAMTPTVSRAQQSIGNFDQISSHNAEKNFIKNPGAEKNAGNITESAAITTRTTTTPLEGIGSFSVDATSSGQTVKFTANTLSDYLKGQNCEAKFVFSGDASLYKAYVEQSSTKLTGDLQLTNETNPRSVSINFPCGTTVTDVRPVIESTSASAAAIKIDRIYLGLATNVGQLGLSVPTTSYTPTLTNFTATINSATYRIENEMMHITGTLTLTGAPSAIITVGLPSGYTINTSKIGSTVVSTDLNSALAFDQTGNIYSGNVSYASTTTITFTGPNTSGRWNATIPFTWASTDTLSYQASFPINESSYAQTLKLNQTPWFVSTAINGANISLGLVDVTSDTEVVDAGLTMTPSSGSSPVGIVCSSTNAAATPSTGTTTCSAGSEGLGASFEIPYPGLYEVCTEFTSVIQVGPAANSLVNQTFKLTETATNAQTTLSGATHALYARHYAVDATQNTISDRPNSLCETFNFSSAGIKAIRLKYQQDVNGTVGSSLISANTASGGNFRLTVKQLSVSYPAPLLVGSVVSNSSAVERIERAKINCDAASSIISQSGTWISTIGNRSGTSCLITIAAGIFAAEPACTLTVESGTVQATAVDTTSVTSMTVYGPSADYDANLICVGQK
jgi:hypothetical protein